MGKSVKCERVFIISSIKPSGDNEHDEPKALNMSKIDEHELQLKPVHSLASRRSG